jgi:methylenetetrahydrofolate dehydrogenase (NADP+)/methenyltetrahydrofolate cyclohydrolase
MKILNGSELVGYIKERQAKQVRGLRQAWRVFPKLAIIIASDNPVIDTYVRLKQRYGEDILIDVAIYRVEQTEVKALIQTLNNDASVHGIVVQLPLADASETDAIVTMIAPEKDVDGLAGAQAQYTSATATAGACCSG